MWSHFYFPEKTMSDPVGVIKEIYIWWAGKEILSYQV
jgi:hypothetical protein